MISRNQFAEEECRIKELRKQGWTENQPGGGIKSWLHGWRQVGRRE